MTSIAALALVVGSTALVVAWLARREGFDLRPTPWDLADVARRQIPILSGQAARAGILRWWEAFLMPTVGIALTVVFGLVISGRPPS